MSYSHLTNKNEQNKKDIYAKSIELEADGGIINRTDWACAEGDLLSDQLYDFQGFTNVGGRSSIVTFKVVRKDIIDDDKENSYIQNWQGNLNVTAPVGANPTVRSFKIPLITNPSLSPDHKVYQSNIKAYHFDPLNTNTVLKTYIGAIRVDVSETYIEIDFDEAVLVANENWEIEYNISVGQTGNL